MSYSLIQIISVGFVLSILIFMVKRILENSEKRMEKSDEERKKESEWKL